MTISKKCLRALAGALLCALPARGYCTEETESTADPQPFVQQTAAGTSWDAQEPIAPGPAVVPEGTAGGVACGGCESNCTPGFQWIVGVESTFFWPQFNRPFLQNTLTNDLGTTTILSSSRNGSAEGNLMAAPRATFGVQGECWGLVGRFWYGSVWSSAFAPSLPNDPSYGLIAFDGLRLYTTDLEAQRRFCFLNWDMYGYGGLRYASVNNDRNMISANSFDGPSLTAVSFSGQQFNGTGLTFGLRGTRPIWCDDSPFKLFFANRYSFLWGNGSVAAQTQATSIDALGTLTSLNGAAARGSGDLFIAELQLGLQWEACLKCLPGRAFLRTSLEYQYWDINTGAQVNSTSFVNVGATGTEVTATASAGNMLFDLIGYSVGAGIMY